MKGKRMFLTFILCAFSFFLTVTVEGQVVYEVWAGETDYTGESSWWDYYYNIDQQDYVKLGESDGDSKTFYGSYSYYVIAAREEFLLDCVQTSNGQYPGTSVTGNTSNYGNIAGPPDSLYATVGYQPSGGTFRGFVVFSNTGSWTSITVITDSGVLLPDLIISGMGNSSITCVPGENVGLPVEVKNLGSGDAEPESPSYFDIAAYISESNDINWEDLSSTDTNVIGEYELTYLASQNKHLEYINFNAPSAMGTYYIRAKADDFDSVQESDENNNWGTVVTLNIECPSADLTGDCFVDFEDFAIMAEQWLTGTHRISVDFEEGFESGDFSANPWQHSGDANWTIVSDTVYEGSYAAKSGTITHDQSSSLEIILDTTSENISFYRKVSSESNYDYLRFYIDGVEQDKWSGSQDLAQETYTITPGEHTFKWSYTKDSSVSGGSDCTWIDLIVLY